VPRWRHLPEAEVAGIAVKNGATRYQCMPRNRQSLKQPEMDQTPKSRPPDATDQATARTGEPIKRHRKPRLRWLILAHVAISLSMGMLVAWIHSPSQPHRAAAGLISACPVLGTRRPILPSIIAVAVAVGLGFCLVTWFPPFAGTVVAYWMTVTSVEVLSLVASRLGLIIQPAIPAIASHSWIAFSSASRASEKN